MKKVSLSGSLRENVGKKDAKRHRKEGNVPCVIYGGKEQTHFIVTELGFKKLIFTPDVFLVNLEMVEKNTRPYFRMCSIIRLPTGFYMPIFWK
jgi:large subunit ribosomal protein L25